MLLPARDRGKAVSPAFARSLFEPTSNVSLAAFQAGNGGHRSAERCGKKAVPASERKLSPALTRRTAGPASWTGQVVVRVKVTNYLDLELKRLNLRGGEPRKVEAEALVDTGAAPRYPQFVVVKSLGLRKTDEVRAVDRRFACEPPWAGSAFRRCGSEGGAEAHASQTLARPRTLRRPANMGRDLLVSVRAGWQIDLLTVQQVEPQFVSGGARTCRRAGCAWLRRRTAT